MKLLIKNGILLDPSEQLLHVKKEVLIEDGKIVKIADHIDEEAEVLDAEGRIVAPGFIDIHAHIFPPCPKLGLNADEIGVNQGVTCIIDAGTAGPENFEQFVETIIKKSKTRIFAEMNYARQGLFITPEADDESKYDIDLAEEVYHKYPEYIVAIKARASNSTVGKLGIKPIQAAKELANRVNKPLYVHIGNPLPTIEDVLNTMQKGDMITHSYHGKINGLLENGELKEETKQAKARGVLFDVGHGVASFNFNTAKAAFAKGFYPDVISTDLHNANVNGPVYSLAKTMDKMLALGISLEDCVLKVTADPAKYFSLNNLGKLKEGYLADITLFHLEEGSYHYEDADGNHMDGTVSIVPDCAIVEGVVQMKNF